MHHDTRRVLCEAANQMMTILAWGYTDSSHDALDLMIDRLRHAHVREECLMNDEPAPSFHQWYRHTYNEEFQGEVNLNG